MDNAYWTIAVRIPKPTRRWLQLSLLKLFVLVILVGAIVGPTGRYLTRKFIAATYHDRSYDVKGFFVDPNIEPNIGPNRYQEFSDLIGDLETTIAPHTWERSGGFGKITFNPANFMLIVRQQESVHRELESVLVKACASSSDNANAIGQSINNQTHVTKE